MNENLPCWEWKHQWIALVAMQLLIAIVAVFFVILPDQMDKILERQEILTTIIPNPYYLIIDRSIRWCVIAVSLYARVWIRLSVLIICAVVLYGVNLVVPSTNYAPVNR